MIQNEETGRVTVVRPTRPASGTTDPGPEGGGRVDARPFADLADWRLQWGPLVAGLLAAITTMTLLGLLGVAIGLTAVDAGAAAAQGRPAVEAGRGAAAWGGISALLAFLIGGYVATRTAGMLDRRWGAWHGALVFLLAVPVLLWLAGQGLASPIGDGLTPGALTDQARAAGAAIAPAEVGRAVAAARSAAWSALVGALIGLGASTLGGYLGVHHTLTQRDRRLY